jgi:short-subunit dehydrogenase involved in D-alanine esterification of teichoic acids
MRSTGNTILIAGATSGIGLGLAERLSEAGNQVIVAGRHLDALRRISDESPEIETVALDVADPASVKAAAAEVVQRHPDLNILVAMAGIMLPEDLHTDGFLSTAEMTVATNLLGPIRLVAALTEHLAGRPEATIITVSSGLAFVPLPLTPTYSATKAAIHSFTQALRMQLSGTPVEVLELIRPAVQTSLMHQDETGQGVPLDVFLDEVMDLLAAGAADEILVKAVEPLRYAEVRGHYAAIFDELSHVGISA